MQRGKCIMNLISQYKGLRKENYVLCFGRFVTAMGAMVRPMLTMILSQKLGMNAVQVAWITALMGILTIPANLIGGKMADRFNKKMNIVYLDMISVISYIICGLIPLTTKSIVLMFIASTCQNIENPSARGYRCGDIRNSYKYQLLYRCSLHTTYHPDPEAILRTEKDNLRIFTDTGRLRIIHPLFRAHPVLLCGNGRTDMG